MSNHLDELLDAFDPNLPLEHARTIPSSWYFDRELYDAECRTVLTKTAGIEAV